VKVAAFWIDKYEVTGMQYLDFSVKTSYQPEGAAEGKTWRTFFSTEKPNVPVTYLTWKDAEEYCKAQGKRLPTELSGKRRPGDRRAFVFHGETNG